MMKRVMLALGIGLLLGSTSFPAEAVERPVSERDVRPPFQPPQPPPPPPPPELPPPAYPPRLILEATAGPAGKVDIVVQGRGYGHGLAGAVINLEYDPSSLHIEPNGGSFTTSHGWTVLAYNFTPRKLAVALVNNDWIQEDAPVLAIRATLKKKGLASTAIVLSAESNAAIDDPDFTTFYAPRQEVAVRPGVKRQLSGASRNAITAFAQDGSKRIAVAAGTRLHVLEVPSLDDAAGWEGGKEIGAEVSGRPALGRFGGKTVIAVGTQAGRLLTFDLSTATPVADLQVDGSVHTAPVISGQGGRSDIYWLLESAEGLHLVHQREGAVSDEALVAPAGSVGSSPALHGNRLVVASTAGVSTFTLEADGRPVPSSNASVGPFSTAPLIGRNATALVATSEGSLHLIDVVRGEEEGLSLSLPAGANPLSDPFGVIAANAVVFGGNDGVLYTVRLEGAGEVATPAALKVAPAPLNMPVVVGDSVYIGDSEGTLYWIRDGQVLESAPLGEAVGRSVVATGTDAASDHVVINTVDGAVHAFPLGE